MSTKSASGRGDQIPPLSGRLSFRIHQLSAQLARIVNPMFREFGIDSVSSQILLLVQEREALGISELLDILHLPQSTISHQLQRLEKRGYLTRERIDKDQRNVTIRLTDAGHHVANECEAASAEVYEAMMDKLPNGTIEEICADLDAIRDRLANLHAHKLENNA